MTQIVSVLVFFIVFGYFFAAGCFLIMYLPFRNWGVENNFAECLCAIMMLVFAYSNISAYLNPSNRISHYDLFISCIKILGLDVGLFYMAKRFFKHYKNYLSRIEITKNQKDTIQ